MRIPVSRSRGKADSRATAPRGEATVLGRVKGRLLAMLARQEAARCAWLRCRPAEAGSPPLTRPVRRGVRNLSGRGTPRQHRRALAAGRRTRDGKAGPDRLHPGMACRPEDRAAQRGHGARGAPDRAASKLSATALQPGEQYPSAEDRGAVDYPDRVSVSRTLVVARRASQLRFCWLLRGAGYVLVPCARPRFGKDRLRSCR